MYQKEIYIDDYNKKGSDIEMKEFFKFIMKKKKVIL